MIWINIMSRLRLSPQAIARTILCNLDRHKPLTKREAERVQSALDNCGVPNATTRLCTGFGKLILRQLL